MRSVSARRSSAITRGVRAALVSFLLILAVVGTRTTAQSIAPTPRVGMFPAVQIGESTNRQLTFRVQFGAPLLQRLTHDGRIFTKVSVPGLDEGSAAAGAPVLPVWRQLIAVPRGGRARIASARPIVSERFPATIYPYQPFAGESSLDVDRFVDQPPPDESFAGPSFTIDPRAYRAGTILPLDPCHVTPVGDARDLQLAQVECSAGQIQIGRSFRIDAVR